MIMIKWNYAVNSSHTVWMGDHLQNQMGTVYVASLGTLLCLGTKVSYNIDPYTLFHESNNLMF